MFYKIEKIRKNPHKTSVWSGGTTTELYIHPKGSIYSEHDFNWRLSSAVVEVERSIFTPLQGITRLVMIMKGKCVFAMKATIRLI
ncbi:HutD family protein [Clostridium sp.]|uniref:HutD family protein n=1 Tax=Clostridium sp. TaxID=1506 RepID=UPI001A5F61EC|nr:HutD family protein [Clostridium sp.]MBK5240500.1 HutD family protein [Clostridium sp.]